MLTDQQFMRYSRQLLIAEIGENRQTQLLNAHIIIIGLGGLGSPAAHYLASAGIGKLTIIDDDIVHISNLQRQTLYNSFDIDKLKTEAAQKRLRAINPDCQITIITQRLNQAQLTKQIKQADVVLDCTDNMPSRLLINRVCVSLSKTCISASAIGFHGQITIFQPPYQHGCYACLYPDGQEVTRNCQTAGVLGPVVGMMGTLQALEAIKKICQIPSLLDSHIQLFNGLDLSWQTLMRSRSRHCPVCNHHPTNEGDNETTR
ncbi:HesA/MoeB/ThiF family protein [Orbaceae bacterium ESL0727]|nr:HesA/MoeB/ThiF family protein [Orbaceae bacterium ESL0727]